MGQLRFFNINRIISEFKIDCFFETGTWKGDGLAYAGKYSFKKLFSSEIIPELAQKAADRFKDDKRFTIINNNSLNALKDKINEINGNCLFWLDAHFPGAEEGVSDYNASSSEQLKYPLEAELKKSYQEERGFQISFSLMTFGFTKMVILRVEICRAIFCLQKIGILIL